MAFHRKVALVLHHGGLYDRSGHFKKGGVEVAKRDRGILHQIDHFVNQFLFSLTNDVTVSGRQFVNSLPDHFPPLVGINNHLTFA